MQISHDVSVLYTSDWICKNMRASNRQDSPGGDESLRNSNLSRRGLSKHRTLKQCSLTEQRAQPRSQKLINK